METWDYYDLAEDQLKAFTRSEVRTKIMLLLKDTMATSGDLEEKMGIRSTTILHSMKELINSGLITKKDGAYLLTNVGKIQVLLLDRLIGAIVLLEQQEEYWLNHDLSGIPEELLAKIGMLAYSERITSDPTAPLKSLEKFMQELSKSKDIRGVSSFIAPGFPELIRTCVKSGSNVELILTNTLLAKISEDSSSMGSDLLDYPNFKLYLLDRDINIGFTVTESLLALGLWRLNGTIDLAGGELICIGEDATVWGRELFDYYKSRSKPINTSNA